ncbi:MAG: hypothetical protein IJ157_03715, partial [Clostridia bacterium]|nr:hypothetical protein [Clostridia bacterium]
MTKVKLKEATKELNQKANAILEESARIRRSAEQLFQQLQRQRTQMLREEEEAQKRLQAEQHTKAWTMPDDEESVQEPVQELAPAPEKEEKKKPEPVETPKVEAPAPAPEAPKAEKPAAEPVPAPAPEAPKAEKPAPA